MNDKLRIKKHEFWSLSGSLQSKVKLTDAQLKRARKMLEKQWAEISAGKAGLE